jgi:hypothetical protein
MAVLGATASPQGQPPVRMRAAARVGRVAALPRVCCCVAGRAPARPQQRCHCLRLLPPPPSPPAPLQPPPPPGPGSWLPSAPARLPAAAASASAALQVAATSVAVAAHRAGCWAAARWAWLLPRALQTHPAVSPATRPAAASRCPVVPPRGPRALGRRGAAPSPPVPSPSSGRSCQPAGRAAHHQPRAVCTHSRCLGRCLAQPGAAATPASRPGHRCVGGGAGRGRHSRPGALQPGGRGRHHSEHCLPDHRRHRAHRSAHRRAQHASSVRPARRPPLLRAGRALEVPAARQRAGATSSPRPQADCRCHHATCHPPGCCCALPAAGAAPSVSPLVGGCQARGDPGAARRPSRRWRRGSHAARACCWAPCPAAAAAAAARRAPWALLSRAPTGKGVERGLNRQAPLYLLLSAHWLYATPLPEGALAGVARLPRCHGVRVHRPRR